MTDRARTAELIDGEWGRFVDTLGAAGPDVWDLPTRLRGWTVEDLARHACWGMTLETHGLRLAGTDGSGRAAGRELTGRRDDVVPALRAARADLARAVREVPHGAVVPMPYGDVPLDLALQVFVMEAAMHRSDLTAAVTGDAGLTPAAVLACAATLQGFWPALARGGATPSPGTGIVLRGETVRLEGTWDGTAWAPSVDRPSVVVHGADEPLLLFAYGRLSLDEAALDVTGDRALAVRFKELVPGP